MSRLGANCKAAVPEHAWQQREYCMQSCNDRNHVRSFPLPPWQRNINAHYSKVEGILLPSYSGLMSLPATNQNILMDSDCSEKEAFLSFSSNQLTTAISDSFDTKLPSRRAPFYRIDFVLHLVLITLYTFAAVSFVRSNSNQGQCLHSPNGDDSTIAPSSPLNKKRMPCGTKTNTLTR